MPVDPANLDADTIQQLPGVDADKAQQLVDGGPYADNAPFLAVLKQMGSSDQADAASAYLAES